MDEPKDLLPLVKAAERLGISRATLWRRVSQLGLTVYVSERDRRNRLISWPELEQAMKPKKVNGPRV